MPYPGHLRVVPNIRASARRDPAAEIPVRVTTPYVDSVDSPAPVRIAIVDDYDVVVQGLARMFEPMRPDGVVEVSTNRRGIARVDIALVDSFAQTRDMNEVLAEATPPSTSSTAGALSRLGVTGL